MSEMQQHEIKTSKTKMAVWRLIGAADVLDAIRKDCPKTLPGVLMATVIAEREVADCRAQVSAGVYCEAAKHGYDLEKVKSVSTTLDHGKPVITVELYDLTDLANGEGGDDE